MVAPNLFKGIAVVIDNGIGTGEAIDTILENIIASGGRYVSMLELPDENYDLDHFARASFFVMDWNLANKDGIPLEAGVRLPAALDKHMVEQNIAFLKRLSKSRHAPVFIFTNESPEKVLEELSLDDELHKSVEESHILVRSKSDVAGKLYEVLETWANETPSVLTLKNWENSFLRAANDLFIDLQNRTPYWPVILWETFDADGVPPEIEMNKLINGLVESRMRASDLDLRPFIEAVRERHENNKEAYNASIYKVLEGERFLRDEKLKDDIYAPGDVFVFKTNEGSDSYHINIRAECDCLRGNENMELYFLKAQIVEDAESRIDKSRGDFGGQKDNEEIIFAMIDGKTFSIKFKDIKVKNLKAIKKDKWTRVGRLLPPFITRVQQRYAGYIQRPGMPRIPQALYTDA